MADTRKLECTCGEVQWSIAAQARGTHLLCYCEDCQTYARALDNGASRLDSDGATEIFQTLPDNIRFEKGIDHVAPLRLSPKGILRWHATCCGTPIANTLPKPGIPFVGAVLPPGIKGYGPITARLSTIGTAPHIKETGVLNAQMSVIGRMLRGLVTGAGRKSPFFGKDGAPITAPRVMSLAERNAARP